MKASFHGLVLGLLCLPALVFAHGASRLQVEESIVINADAMTVWNTIKQFDAIHTWHPAIESTEAQGGNAVGATRTLFIAGGATIQNTLKAFDETAMRLQYDIDAISSSEKIQIEDEWFDAPDVPVSRYKGWVSVDAVDGGSKVTLMGKFFRAYTGNHHEPDHLNDHTARETIAGFYRAGLESLKSHIEQ